MAGKKQQKPQVNTGGGANIGGKVETGGGDFVGRDKKISGGERSLVIGGNVSGSTLVTGDHNTVNNAPTQNVLAPVYLAIQGSTRPTQEKEDLKAEVEEIEAGILKGELVDEPWLGRKLRTLKRMAPEIGEVALAALSGPGAAAGAIVKKVAEKVKGEG